MHAKTPGRVLVTMALAIGLAGPAHAQATGDDLFLVTTNLAPNVILIQDNSVSMNHIEWHWDFDPTGTPDCTRWVNGTEYAVDGAGALDPAAGTLTLDAVNEPDTDCHRTRTIYNPANPLATLYDGRYLNWLFSAASDPHVVEIDTAVHLPPPCNQPACGACDQKYRRTRDQMGKQVLLDTLCIAEPLGIRFGQAFFRDPDNNPAKDDPNGGYVAVRVDDPSPAHASDLEAHIKNLQSVTETPLGETLFQIYTYFMSRVVADIPFGNDGLTKFPKYSYKESTGQYTNQAQQIPEDPVEGICQKHFVVIVTDGAPDRDTFDADPPDTAQGFGDFNACIGDYNVDGEIEVPAVNPLERAWYLDDIAKYMHEKDFRLDHADDQTLDVYTIGLATDASTDVFLQRVADVSDGLFFRAKDGDSLSQALVNALNDILKKAQSFTAATVPSSRTADGGDFYTSYFQPSGKRAFWDGHLRSWHITAKGDIEDSLGNCALIDPDVGECNSGPFDPLAVPFWDAGSKVPLPAARTLHVSKAGAMTSFDASLTATDLTIASYTTPGAPPDPTPNNPLYLFVGSTAEDEEELADEVVGYTRGCQYGTGAVTGGVAVPCVPRAWRLGDLFHSNPIVVRQPNGPSKDASYTTFKTNYTGRDRMIYAGANDGFLHAFHAGVWDGVTKTYDGGTGVEKFGFMPWQARLGIKNQAVDSPAARTYYVDGSPQQSDVWVHPTPTSSTKAASEWKTLLMGGLRQGGNQYYALDVTNPASLSYPGYLWEFPREADTNNILDPNSFLPYLGETWGSPILTRIRVKVGADDNGGMGYERWVAVVTGGYSPSGDPNDKLNYDATDSAPPAGRSLYILDVKTGQVLAEKKFDPLALDEQQHMRFAIPATPSVFDSDGDGFADLIYVGDLGGNIWKWVIKDVGEDRVNDLSGLRTQPSWAFRRVFNAPRAKISGGLWRYKSFFTQIAGTLDGGHVWLLVGSGERANLPWPGEAGNDDENNRLYVVIDKDRFEQLWLPPYLVPAAPALAMVTQADLDDLSNTAACSSINGLGYSFMVGDGEKFVTRSNIFAGLAIAATFTPLSNAANVCGAKGDGVLYIFDLLCGKGWFDDGAGNPTRGLDIGLGFPTDPQVSTGVGGTDNRIYIEKSSSSDEGGGSELFSLEAPDLGKESGGLIYWRETQ